MTNKNKPVPMSSRGPLLWRALAMPVSPIEPTSIPPKTHEITRNMFVNFPGPSSRAYRRRRSATARDFNP
jgi:hypothetical protein